MKFYFLYILFFFSFGCVNSARHSEEKSDIMFVNQKDTTGFFSNCDQWSEGYFNGYLQNVPARKDSLGPFWFYECFDCNLTYRIIFMAKNKANQEALTFEKFSKNCINKYKDFNCYSFIYPMRNPDKQVNVHDSNIDFPLSVKAYERMQNDSWRLVNEITVKTFSDLSLFQFKTIYHLNDKHYTR